MDLLLDAYVIYGNNFDLMERNEREIQLHPEWLSLLADEFKTPSMINLRAFLLNEKKSGKIIFPPGDLYFNSLNMTPFSAVKAVIIGQDPYHGTGQAHGLCFSVLPGISLPPSLKNIFEELKNDLGIPPSIHGTLTAWAEQGVLLLNAVLSVEKDKPASHQGQGWEAFTDRIISLLNEKKEHLVFILWGSYAQKKGSMIDRKRHLVLEAPHPSPLSSYRGFFGSRPFSQCNSYLTRCGILPVDWRLPPA